VSFGFAAQSLLAALGSAQFISNVFFGKVILGEVSKGARRTEPQGKAFILNSRARSEEENLSRWTIAAVAE